LAVPNVGVSVWDADPVEAAMRSDSCVSYEAFGAVGDGVADDLPAICAAHDHANAHGLPVRARADAAYHLGSRALTAIIATDTDWGTARFLIDDTAVEDRRCSLFEVKSLLLPLDLTISRLTRDQRSIDIHPQVTCFVLVENEARRVYIREGRNQNPGVPQHDVFILHPDGRIEGDIDGDYERISRIEVRPLDAEVLVVRGGVFTTIANRMVEPQGYRYWARNIRITRSNTVIDGLTHYVVGETAVGHPYSGFLNAAECANVTFRDCFATGHKIYQTIGTAGLPVSMGSYDLHAHNIVNFTMRGCRMNHILDRTRWGVIASNFCKNIVVEDCVLSRMDTHMGVSGSYVIRGCTLGHMGLNAIGRGLLRIEGSTLYGPHIASFRGDYGSTWDGAVEIVDSRWIPSCGDQVWPHLFGTHNQGTHDFGYPCSMPRTVTLENLRIEDARVPPEYTGPHVFTAPGGNGDSPFPYARCREVRVRGLQTASGKPLGISSDPGLNAEVRLVSGE